MSRKKHLSVLCKPNFSWMKARGLFGFRIRARLDPGEGPHRPMDWKNHQGRGPASSSKIRLPSSRR